ncbi:fungal-specific transcription factor domain-containing protein [Lipomyces kononenkoae]|uniref:Fungal-specific transcription factor domain-containing protein n=1 Tax=Lipomyces kononenkoae TaxID=34357 RepID=A0ACC3T8E8_LIPKO
MTDSTPPVSFSTSSSSTEEGQRQDYPVNNRWPAQFNGKIAIPRRRPHVESMASAIAPSSTSVGRKRGTGAKSPRISHACESCRLRKTKCSGERPACSHCIAFGIECNYVDNRRDRTRQELQDLREKVHQYESTFKKIAPALDQPTKELLSQVFPLHSPAEQNDKTPRDNASRDSIPATQDDDSEAFGEDLVSAEAGSTGSIDHLNDDISSIGISSPEGYVGKSSDIDWIKKIFEVAKETENYDTENVEKGFLNPRISEIETVSYNLDDLEIAVESVDLNSMPPKEIADKLIDYYFETVHPSFQFLLEPLFRYQYDIYCAGYLDTINTQWLALLNLVLAISSIYAHNAKAEAEGHELDHLQYYIRSKLLKPNVTAPGDLQHIQYVALLSFYLFASSHVNRSYSMLGLAIRNGQGIGLHLQLSSTGITDVQKEVRVRLWNALYVFERMVCSMTGRPSMISDERMSAPLPSVSAETDNWEFIPQMRQRTLPKTTIHGGQHFLYEIGLSKILGKVMDRLYVPAVINERWSTVQQIIEELNNELDKWKDGLTDEFSIDFNIDIASAGDDLTRLRMRTILAFQYYDIKRLINRPCLCHTEIPNESAQSKEFSWRCAVQCMQAGHRSLSLIPDLVPSPTLHQLTRDLIRVLPWWNIAHYLMSSMSAIVLGHIMDFKPDWPNEDDIRTDLDKCFAWFRSFEEDSLTAKRCADIISEFKGRVLRKVSSTHRLQPIRPDQSLDSQMQKQESFRQPSRPEPLYSVSQPRQPEADPSPYYYSLSQSPFNMQSYSAYYAQDVERSSSSSSTILNTPSARPYAPTTTNRANAMFGTNTRETHQHLPLTHPISHQMGHMPLQEQSSTGPHYYSELSENPNVAGTAQQNVQIFEPHALQSVEHPFNSHSSAIHPQNTSQLDNLAISYTPQHTAEYMLGLMTDADILPHEQHSGE